jgi:hypothetical protein
LRVHPTFVEALGRKAQSVDGPVHVPEGELLAGDECSILLDYLVQSFGVKQRVVYLYDIDFGGAGSIQLNFVI